MTKPSHQKEDAATATTKTGPTDQRQRDDDTTAIDSMNPLTSLTEPERLALAIKFGRVRMCAALTHGHSFESSIFRLPAKCSGCHELVWGPFTRGCTCLTCKLTAHRSCVGMAAIPRCPTKDLFVEFCRSELGLPKAARSCSEEVAPDSVAASTGSSAGQDRVAVGDLDEWATVEGTTDHSCRLVEEDHSRNTPLLLPPPPASAAQAVRDSRSSFSWSPLGTSDIKRPVAHDKSENCQQQQQESPVDTNVVAEGGEPANADALLPLPADMAHEKNAGDACAKDPDPATAAASTACHSMGIRGVGKMSVAGGVVGAVLGGPVGAVVGLKLGAFLGAGRWSVQGLWQRIEKDRQEAGAEGIGLLKASDGRVTLAALAAEEAIARMPRDVWARIAEKIEGEKQPLIWELDPEQIKLLEQGECDAGEVAMFVVGKVLADETAMPSHLYGALLAEFRSRHRLCDCRRPPRRRSSDADMVELFPRAGGSRRAVDGSRLDSSAHIDGTSVFGSTPGLEKTFSFVEEAEIVEGEGSDTASGDDGDGNGSSVEGSDRRRDDTATSTRPGPTKGEARPGVAVPSPTPVSPGAAVAPATAQGAATAATTATAPRDSWRNSSSRIDSWVELEGVGCGSCGGKVAGGSSQGRFTDSLGRDVEEDEGGFGESWAAADAPPCWCADEGGLSASPEIVPNMLRTPGRDVAGGGDERIPTPGVDKLREPREMFAAEEATQRGGRSDLALVATDEPALPVAQAVVDSSERPGQPDDLDTGTGKTACGAMGEDIGDEEESCDALRDVHGLLRELTRAILAWCPLLTASDEAAIQAVNCIDQRVFSETYGPVYGRIASGQARERDATLAQRVRREERSRKGNGQPSLTAVCRPEVLVALRTAGAARTGRDKLGFLVQAVERISEALPAKATTDTLLWSLCRHLAAATLSADATVAGRLEDGGGCVPLSRPHAEVAFVEQFVRDESWLMGKPGYVLTTVDAALHILLDPTMSDEIFLDPPATSEIGDSNGGGRAAATGRTTREDGVL